MQGEKAHSGKRRGRGKKRSKEDAAPASVNDSTVLRSDFIPEQLATLRAIESLIGDLDLTGEQATIGEEMLIELHGACSELAALNTGPVAGPRRVNEAAQRISALAETFSGLLEGAASGSVAAAAAGSRRNA